MCTASKEPDVRIIKLVSQLNMNFNYLLLKVKYSEEAFTILLGFRLLLTPNSTVTMKYKEAVVCY